MEKESKLTTSSQIPPDVLCVLIALEQQAGKKIPFYQTISNALIYSYSVDGPFVGMLDLLYFGAMKWQKKGKPSKVQVFMIESFKDYCKQRDMTSFLTRETKIRAVNVASINCNQNTIQIVCDIFHLKEEKENLIEVIGQLLEEKKFKEGFFFITALEMEGYFPLESCAFPLFFLGHESLVKQYLSKSAFLSTQFVQTLDEVSENNTFLQDFIRSLAIDLPGGQKRGNTIDVRWVTKRLPALLDHFDIDIKKCPNMYYWRCLGAMRYLVRKMFVECTISYQAWEELTLDVVSELPVIQYELLVKLVSINQSAVAFRIAGLLNFPPARLPAALHIRSEEHARFDPETYSWGRSGAEGCLPFRLERSDICLVDTPDLLHDAVEDIRTNYDTVGMDAEWKPNLGIQKERATLCQLAVWDCVYLVDVQALQKYQDPHVWRHLVSGVFCNPELLKLGYGGRNDLNVLLRTVGYHNTEEFKNLIDLSVFFSKLKAHHPEAAAEMGRWGPPDDPPEGGEEEEALRGLSQLCRAVLGKPLDKREQFSNWERRPLRETQIFYAALDAFCLLMVYEKMYPVLKKRGLSLESVSNAQKPSNPKKEKPKASNKKVKVKATPIKNFRVVVDNVGGVTKYLRLLGADVKSLTDTDDHMRAVEIAQKENRVIISQGAPYEKIRGYMPEGMCFCPDARLHPKEVIAEVLKYFNVQCQDSDIFSRCTVCNETQYVHVNRSELLSLWTRHVRPNVDAMVLGRKNTTAFPCDVVDTNGSAHRGLCVQLAAFSPQVFDHVTLFYVCSGCGKVYWEGSHLSRLRSTIAQLVPVASSHGNVYKVLKEQAPH